MSIGEHPRVISKNSVADFALDDIVHATPQHHPSKVHELSSHLFNAYTLNGGNVRLAGCMLEDRLLVCLHIKGANNNNGREVYLAVDDTYNELADQQRVLSDDFVETLNLTETTPLEAAPLRVSREQVKYYLNVTQRIVAANFDNTEINKIQFLWCKYAEGKLRFEFQDQSEEVTFANWAKLLEAPQFHCPFSGKKTFQLDITDDKKIAAAEAITICDLTGQRVLFSETAKCAVTGQRAVLSEIAICPASEETVLKSELTACPQCKESISPNAAKRNSCVACRKLTSVKKADPRMACILGQYPGLDRWRNWSLKETRSAYILQAKGLLRRLLVVLDKETLEPRRLALGSKLKNRWTDLEELQAKEMLE